MSVEYNPYSGINGETNMSTPVVNTKKKTAESRELLRLLLITRKSLHDRREKRDLCMRSGICTHATRDLGYVSRCDVEGLVRARARSWPKFSGDNNYPVPGTPWCSARDMYYVSFGNAELMWDGDYGALREELLNWLIDTLQAELGETPDKQKTPVVSTVQEDDASMESAIHFADLNMSTKVYETTLTDAARSLPPGKYRLMAVPI